jgi:hypothetical protein
VRVCVGGGFDGLRFIQKGVTVWKRKLARGIRLQMMGGGRQKWMIRQGCLLMLHDSPSSPGLRCCALIGTSNQPLLTPLPPVCSFPRLMFLAERRLLQFLLLPPSQLLLLLLLLLLVVAAAAAKRAPSPAPLLLLARPPPPPPPPSLGVWWVQLLRRAVHHSTNSSQLPVLQTSPYPSTVQLRG